MLRKINEMNNGENSKVYKRIKSKESSSEINVRISAERAWVSVTPMKMVNEKKNK